MDTKPTQRTIQIASPAFENNSSIPSKYTCDGENINPPLSFSHIPSNTKSMVLIVDDPDAPMGTWTHWVLYNIPPQTTTIMENAVPEGAGQTKTSFGKEGWGGPCPPSGTHRYYFKIYAMDSILQLSNPTRDALKNAMSGHIINSGELIGLYQKK